MEVGDEAQLTLAMRLPMMAARTNKFFMMFSCYKVLWVMENDSEWRGEV